MRRNLIVEDGGGNAKIRISGKLDPVAGNGVNDRFDWIMNHRTPQRSYTPRTVEAWFSRLSQDWEQWFERDELDWGRRYYRTGEVRSTELMDSSAVVHFKRGKDALYIIVDWEEGAPPSFRLSHPDFGRGRGLAVAGMYELEEFISEEIPPVPEELVESPPTAAMEGSVVNGNGSGNGSSNGSGNGHARGPAETTESQGRRLCLRLRGMKDGLLLEAGWELESGERSWKIGARRELSSWEREQLIGYTARAHRNGFRPGEGNGTHFLRDPSQIHRFLRAELPKWRRRMPIEVDATTANWQSGLRELRPVIRARASGERTLFRLEFVHEDRTAKAALRNSVLKNPGGLHFIPGAGMFQVRSAAIDELHDWKAWLPGAGEGELPRYLLFSLDETSNLQIDLSEDLKKWRSEVQASLSRSDDLDLPGYLRPYQCDGVRWLRNLEAAGCHCLLADEMGLGKTLQVLTFLHSRQLLGNEPVLVVCPASVVPVWQAEAARFFPELEVQLLGRQSQFGEHPKALWLASYTQLRRNKHQLETTEFACAILDEAQSIKNPDAKVTHACQGIRSRLRIAMTGTPLENRPLDLWTLFRFLMPGLLGSRHRFEDATKNSARFIPRLRQQIAPFVLRRTKAVVADDLPPKVESVLSCPLTPLQRRLYTELVAGAGKRFGSDMSKVSGEERMHLFSLLTRLRQACCDPQLLPGTAAPWNQSGKLLALVQTLGDAIESGSKVIIFSQFVRFLYRARAAFKETWPEVPTFELTGATLKRERPVADFRRADGAAAFFISLRAGGTGLNLQEADYLFLLDPWWNPAVEAQAIDRVHRIGQKKRVFVYRMVTPGTVEDRIEQLKSHKQGLFDDLLSELDAPADFLAQFNSLEALIALRGEPS
jgi:hypothetical protein